MNFSYLFTNNTLGNSQPNAVIVACILNLVY